MRISRAKVENFISLCINVVNIVLYVLVFAAAIVKSIDASLGEIIQSVYCCTMCLLLAVNECKTFALAQIYFGFLGVHQGRGFLLVFLGCLVMCNKSFNVIVTILNFTIGLAYLILSFLPHMPPPNPLSVHWQHRQDFWAEGLDLHPPPHPHKTSSSTPPAFPHPSSWHPSSPYYTSHKQIEHKFRY
ncbi:COPI associated protein-domain-containing protein [Fennellomyces sp. T-0311]|nr:COPI associated protein-domain-containing protein [Fennellomyces sp. T-0311]